MSCRTACEIINSLVRKLCSCPSDWHELFTREELLAMSRFMAQHDTSWNRAYWVMMREDIEIPDEDGMPCAD